MSSLDALARPSLALGSTAGSSRIPAPNGASMMPAQGQQSEEGAASKGASASPAVARDKRLQLVGIRKSGYSGHVPKCIYYDRERLPASIHSGHNIPTRGKLQLDGTFAPTQSMVRERQRQQQQRSGVAMGNVPSLSEIGLPQRASSAKGGHGVGMSGEGPAEMDTTTLSRPFSNNPSGRGAFGHYSVDGTTADQGTFTNAVSSPRSPTARYYRQLQEARPGAEGLVASRNGGAMRFRHVGAGGVCCGTTPPKQYGHYLHHEDEAIHGAETGLLPHIYGAVDVHRPMNEGNVHAAFNGSLRSGGARDGSAASTRATGGGLEASGGRQLEPFPRYPVLRGPNRMGPRGLETFLTN